MKQLSLILCFLLSLPVVRAQKWEWAYPIISYGGTKLLAVRVNSTGQPYFMGWSQTQTTFNANNGPFVLSGLNTFVSKFDEAGNIQWLSGGWGTSVWGRSMSIDKYSNCYLTGQFGGAAYFGIDSDTLHKTVSTLDYFLAKLDANGKAVFFRHEGDTCNDIGTSVTASQTDEVIVTWTDQLACDHYDAFKAYLKKTNSMGNEIWSLKQPFEGVGSSPTTHAPNMGFLFSGYWFGSVLKLKGVSDTLSLSPPVPADFCDTYLAKYSLGGNPEWAKTIRGKNYQFIKGLFANNTGIYIAVDSYDSCYYDNILLLPKGERTQHIVKADTSGNYIMHISFPASIYPTLFWIKDLKSDVDGNIYLLARVNMPLQIGNDTIAFDRLPNEQAISIIKLDTGMNYIWSQYLTYEHCNCWGGELAITDSLVYVGINYDGAVSLHGSNFQFPSPIVSTSDNCFVAAIRNGASPVSISENSLSAMINIFPNPTTGVFTVTFAKQPVSTKLCVYDVLGNCILDGKPMNNLNQVVDLSNQSKGIYFLEIQSSREKLIKKIVFQ